LAPRPDAVGHPDIALEVHMHAVRKTRNMPAPNAFTSLPGTRQELEDRGRDFEPSQLKHLGLSRICEAGDESLRRAALRPPRCCCRRGRLVDRCGRAPELRAPRASWAKPSMVAETDWARKLMGATAWVKAFGPRPPREARRQRPNASERPKRGVYGRMFSSSLGKNAGLGPECFDAPAPGFGGGSQRTL